MQEYSASDAAQTIMHAMDTICSLYKENSKSNDTNTELTKKLNSAVASCSHMTQVAIYYDAVYSRLPQEQQKAFDAIGKEVIKEFGLTSLE